MSRPQNPPHFQVAIFGSSHSAKYPHHLPHSSLPDHLKAVLDQMPGKYLSLNPLLNNSVRGQCLTDMVRDQLIFLMNRYEVSYQCDHAGNQRTTVLLIFLGGNNLRQEESPSSMVERFRPIFDFAVSCSNIRLVVSSLIPERKRRFFNQFQEANNLLHALVKEYSQTPNNRKVFFFPVHRLLKAPGSQQLDPTLWRKDSIHLNALGQQRVANGLRPLLQNIQ